MHFILELIEIAKLIKRSSFNNTGSVNKFMKDYGLVSIITPTWECAKYITETIHSIQIQSYHNWELLIQDDCSTDGTDKMVESFADHDTRIKYECNAMSSGAAITRNNALRRAKGKWIAFLDSDDVWLPEKLDRQLKYMIENNYAFSYHEYTEMNEGGNDLGIYISGIEKVNKISMLACCWPGCLTVMYNQEKIGLVQIKDVRKNNDTALWLKIVDKSKCYLLKENLARYRRREVSITPKSLWERVLAHYHLFRLAEGMRPIKAAFWTLINCIGHVIKKTFYVKHINL